MPSFRISAVLVALAFVLTLPGQAAAADYTVGSLKITQPWARATPKGAITAAAYLTVTNTGSNVVRLSCSSTNVAAKCQIHEMAMTDGVMKMRPAESGLEIKPGDTVTLKPGGYHIMLEGVKTPLKVGSEVEATLTSSDGGKVKVEFPVAAIGAPGPGTSADGNGMKMQGPAMAPMQRQ